MKIAMFYSRKGLAILLTLLIIGVFSQCQRPDGVGPGLAEDTDSDAPEWAGGNTDDNDHINQNDDSGTTRGGDYGDLYVLLRDDNGVPEMTTVDVNQDGVIQDDEYFVQPIDEDGNEIELDQYGEVPEGSPVIEVDFGRLNIVRSPQSVLDQALGEAIAAINSGNKYTLDFCGRLSIWSDDVFIKTIDSPRENMAMYQYLMNFMFEETAENNYNNQLAFLANYQIDALMLAAGCFAAGSDKTGTVDIDEVVYINGFLDCTGLNKILNEYEYDFNNDNKYYFNFTEPIEGEAQFQYNRSIFKDRYIQFLVWDNVYYPLNEEGVSEGPVYSIFDIFEGLVEFKGIGDQPQFTYRWEENEGDKIKVDGFAAAIDDAVQVLDFVHGDSNILFLPNYEPEE